MRRPSGEGHASEDVGNPLLKRLDPGDGQRLLALPGDHAGLRTTSSGHTGSR
jgi:hypothetical protein